MAAVSFSDSVYLLGGSSDDGRIARFHPDTASLEVLNATLPTPRIHVAAVWTGAYVYLFGGRTGQWDYSPDILRFDPVHERIDHVGSLPTGEAGMQAVWDGTSILVFGGQSQAWWNHFRFDPSTHTLTQLPTWLPHGRADAATIWDGRDILVFAGCCDQEGAHEVRSNSIWRYDPIGQRFLILDETLPDRSMAHGSAFLEPHTYLFGGWNGVDFPRILRITHDRTDGRPMAIPDPEFPGTCADGAGLIGLDGTRSYDPAGGPVALEWLPESGLVLDPTAPRTQGAFPLGITNATLRATNAQGLTHEARFLVRVVDLTPPTAAVLRPHPGAVYAQDIEVQHPAGDAPPVAQGPLTVRVDAHDECALAGVEFRFTHGPLGEERVVFDPTPPYEAVFAPWAPGVVHLAATAQPMDGPGTTVHARWRHAP
jgi:hypothetical protein